MAVDTLFRRQAPDLIRDLRRDFPFTTEDAAAILGNAGHESNGFRTLQEIRPTVAGSRGGFGWFQWTGPRRRAFEAFCKQRGLDPTKRNGNYAFLCHELKNDEKAAVNAVRHAKGLDAKVVAFEQTYERAGVKHYPSRIRWAKIALEEFQRQDPGAPDPVTTTTPPTTSMARSREGNGAAVTGAIATVTVATEIGKQIKEATDTASGLLSSLANPVVLGMFAIACIAAAIWFWRRQRLHEDGV